MIRPSHLVFLALLFPALLSFGFAPASVGWIGAPSLQQRELDRDEFMKQFRRAMENRADSEMASLVKRNEGTATVLIIEICEVIARETDERLEQEIGALQSAWKEAFGSRFATEMYEYFSLMRLQVRAFRAQKKDDFGKNLREYDKAVAAKNFEHLDAACANFATLAAEFASAGDHYYVSECWLLVAQGYDEHVRGNHADFAKAGDAYAKVVEARVAIDLKDRIYAQAKARSDQLFGSLKRDAERSGEPVPEPGGTFTRKKPGVALGAEVPQDLTFSSVDDIEAILRPGYALHDLPMVWTQLLFGRSGSVSEIYTFAGGPQAIRTGGGVDVDTDRDGKGDLPVPLTGNIEAVEFTVGEGDSLRKWGFLSVVLTEREVYQGIGVPMQPADAYLSVPIAPSASMIGSIDGTAFRVIDENMDGVYGSQPTSWANLGLTEGRHEPVIDTLVLGSEKRAVPWSEYVSVGPKWYQFLSDRNGTRVVTAPAQLETGTLKVKAKGITPLYLIVRGAGTFEYSYFDVMAGGSKGIQVPTGSYTLLFGEVRKGKRTQVLKALILPGDGMAAWTVKPGETTEISLGAPFDLEFKATDAAGKVKITGASVAVLGAAKERYERLWNCTLQPEAFLRKAGTKKGGRGETMDIVLDQETLFGEGFKAGWFPRDLEIDKRGEEAPVELQLVEKKNKLFGEIESTWRPTGK